MTFNEVLEVLRNSDIDDKVKFAHGGMCGYFVKEELGELIYYFEGHAAKEANFYLSDFDRDDWEIIHGVANRND